MVMPQTYANVQERAQNTVYKWLTGALQKIENAIEALNSLKFISVSGIFIVSLYVYLYFNLPWILWKNMFADVGKVLIFPFLISVFATVIANIYDFADYENRKSKYHSQDLKADVQLHVWGGQRYYRYVKYKNLRRVAMGYNVNEDL